MKKFLQTFFRKAHQITFFCMLFFAPFIAMAQQTNPLNCLNFKVTVKEHATCPNSGVLTFDTIGLGGVKPYSFSVTSSGCVPAVSQVIQDTFILSLKGGCTYTVKVTDNSTLSSAFCTKTVLVEDLYPQMQTPTLTQNGCDFTASIIGGKGPYKYYLYNNTGTTPVLLGTFPNIAQTSYTFTNVKQQYGVDKYQVKVEDACGAFTAPKNINLLYSTIPVTATLNTTNDLLVTLNVPNAPPGTTYKYKLFIGGVLTDSITGGGTSVTFPNLTPACNTNNYVEVTGSDCSKGSKSFFFNVPPLILAVACINFDAGTASVTASGGTLPYADFKCYNNFSSVPIASSSTGNFTGLTGATTFKFSITDACNNPIQSVFYSKPVLQISSLSAVCGSTTSNVNIFGALVNSTNNIFIPVTATCISCNPVKTLNTAGNTFSSSTLPTNFVLEVKDKCDNKSLIKDTLMFEFKDNLPCLTIDVKPPTYRLKYVNGAFIGGAWVLTIPPTDTLIYQLWGPNGKLAENKTGKFTMGLTYGVEYTVKLITPCGLETYKKITLIQQNGGSPPSPSVSYGCIQNALLVTISSAGLIPPASLLDANGNPKNFDTPLPLGTYTVSDCNGIKVIVADGSGSAPSIKKVDYDKFVNCVMGVFVHKIIIKNNSFVQNGSYQLVKLPGGQLMPSNDGKTFDNLTAGTYKVIGVANCTEETIIELVDPPKEKIFYTLNPPKCDGGTFLFNITNVYSLLYGGPFQLLNAAGNPMVTTNNGLSFENLVAGTYTLKGNCAEDKIITITDPDKLAIPYTVEVECTPTGLAYKVTVTNQQLKPFTLGQIPAINGVTFLGVQPGSYNLDGKCSNLTPIVLPPFPEMPKIQTTFVKVCTKYDLTAKTKDVSKIWIDWRAQNSTPLQPITIPPYFTVCTQAATFTLKNNQTGVTYNSSSVLCQNDSLIAKFDNLQDGFHTLTLNLTCNEKEEKLINVPKYVVLNAEATRGLLCGGAIEAKVRVWRPSNTKGFFTYELIDCNTKNPIGAPLAVVKDTFFDIMLPVGKHCIRIFDPCGDGQVTETEVKAVGKIVPDYSLECGFVTLKIGKYAFCTYKWVEKNTTTVLSDTTFLKLPLSNVTKTYVVTIHSDFAGCDVVREIILSPSDGAVPDIEIKEKDKNHACFGGSVQLVSNVKNMPIDTVTYNWMFKGAIVSSLINVPTYTAKEAGWYYVISKNKHGCFTKDSIEILIPTVKLEVTPTKTDVSCYHFKNGEISIEAKGGIPPYKYDWSNGKTTSSINGLDIGDYTVTLTDFIDCIDIKTIKITEPKLLTEKLVELNEKNCNLDLKITANGGMAPYTFSVNNLTTVKDSISAIFCLSVGTYTVSVTDKQGCTVSIDYVFKKENLPTKENPINVCFGGSYQYTKDVYENGVKVGIVKTKIYDKDGVYYDTLSANACRFCDTILKTTIKILDPVVAQAIAVKKIICFKIPTTIKASATGGMGQPYKYDWSTGSEKQEIIGDMVQNGGFFRVTVTDILGCKGVAVENITEAPKLTGSFGSTQINCINPNSGALGINPLGGTQPYYFLWSNGKTTDKIVNLSKGTYSVTVTDGNDCPLVASYTLEGTTPLGLNFKINKKEVCGDEKVTLGANGTGASSSGDYLYSCTNGKNNIPLVWDNAGIKWNFASVGVGTYIVKVWSKKDYECPKTDSVIIKSSSLQSKIIQKDSLCQGGSVKLEATVATGKVVKTINWYEFPAWKPVGTANVKTLTVDKAGTYALVQESDKGCKDTAKYTVKIWENPKLETAGDKILCNGDKGFLEGKVMNNIANPQGYLWIFPDGTTVKDTSKVAITKTGLYILKTVDKITGCASIDSIKVEDLKNWIPTITKNKELCEGQYVTLETPVGTVDKIFWSKDGVALTKFDGLNAITISEAGKYTVKVKKFQCEGQSGVFEVEMNKNPVVQMVSEKTVCKDSTFVLKAETTSIGTYKYKWSDNATTSAILAKVGSYFVTVTDIKGCTAIADANIKEYPQVLPEFETVKKICPNDTLKLALNGKYDKYDWSNGVKTATLTITKEGVYSTTVTNDKGCKGSASITVTAAVPVLPVLAEKTPCYDTKGTITLTNASDFTKTTWQDGSTKSDFVFSGKIKASVKVVDINGCPSTKNWDTKEYPKPTVTPIVPTICQGNNGNITLKETFTSYLWGDNSTLSTLNNVKNTDTYYVTVTDVNGCTASTFAAITIKENPKPNVAGANKVCVNDEFILTANATNSSKYEWSNNGGTGAFAKYNTAGTYTVTVTDSFGCIGTASKTVTIADGLEVQIPVKKVCTGKKATLDPGVFDTYKWSNGATTRTIDVTTPGTYTVEVSTKNCKGTGTVTVLFLENPTVDITGKLKICDGELTVISTNSSNSIIWSTGEINTKSITVKAGTYSVTVTDANGCTAAVEETIIELGKVVPELVGEPKCVGDVVSLGVKNSNLYSSITWQTGETTANIKVSKADAYNVTVTDLNGCVGENKITSVFNPLPTVKIQATTKEPCALEKVDIEAISDKGNTYNWSNNVTTPKQSVTEGAYIVTVTDKNGCVAKDAVTLKELPQIAVSMQVTGTKVCKGDSVILGLKFTNLGKKSADITIAIGTSFITLKNIKGDTVFAIKPTESATYILQNITVLGVDCPIAFDKNIKFEVKASKLEAIISSVEQKCFGEKDGKVELKSNGISYLWNNGNKTSILSNLGQGTYTVTVSDDLGCFMVKSVTLKEPQPVDIEVVSKDLCVGSKNGAITMTTISGKAPFEYVYNGKSSPQTTMNNLEKGIYKVYAQDAKGCKSKEQTVEIKNFPVMKLQLVTDSDSLNIIKTDSLEIKALLSIDGKSVTNVQNEKLQNFDWSPYPCKDCLSIFSKKDSSTTYYLKIIDQYGCKVSDKIRITLRDANHDYTTPTGVTKDNPFTILPRQGDIRKINVLRVFDRWGNMMYEEKNFKPSREIGWDGTYRGIDVDPAVYAWFAVIEYKDGFVLVVKGDVTVAR